MCLFFWTVLVVHGYQAMSSYPGFICSDYINTEALLVSSVCHMGGLSAKDWAIFRMSRHPIGWALCVTWEDFPQKTWSHDSTYSASWFAVHWKLKYFTLSVPPLCNFIWRGTPWDNLKLFSKLNLMKNWQSSDNFNGFCTVTYLISGLELFLEIHEPLLGERYVSCVLPS